MLNVYEELELVEDDNYLAHYGILGMKWGVRRWQNEDGSYKPGGDAHYAKLENKNERYELRAARYDRRAAKYEKRSEKSHAIHDLDRSNRAARKSAKYAIKSAKYEKRSAKSDSDFEKAYYDAKAAKYQFKSDQKKRKADRLSKQVGYNNWALHLALKSDRVEARASKMRMKIANNKKIMRNIEVAKFGELAVKQKEDSFAYARKVYEEIHREEQEKYGIK